MNKKQLLHRTHKKFIDIGLGDETLEGIDELIDHNIIGYGTTIDEKILSINDYRDLIKRQRNQGENLEINYSIKPVKYRISADSTSAVMIDEVELNINDGGKSNVMFLRLSSVYEYNDDRWSVVHWHGSKPEYDSNQSDTWHVDEWKQKTAELEKIVEEKTSELLVKNRELEIEAALERVRVRAMAMQKSDELRDAATVLYKELSGLGIEKFINCGYVLIDEEKNVQNAWMTAKGGKIREVHQMPLTGDEIMDERYEMWKKRVPIFHQIVGGEKLKIHNAFASGQSISKEEPINMLLDLPDPTVFYFGNFSEGYLHILAEEVFSPETEKILSRFASVFEITFRRFLDLQKAEVQAREAQIEAALERIRSKTMAMQSSDEIREVVSGIYKEIEKLGIDITLCLILIYDCRTNKIEWWSSGLGADILPVSYNIPITEQIENHPLVKHYFNAQRNGVEFELFHLKGEEKDSWDEYIFSKSELKHLPDEVKRGMRSTKSVFLADAFMRHGSLSISLPEAIQDEKISIIKRMAKAIDLTFSRFYDLKKAEEQAREARIESALERVRAKAMSMRSSEDLSTTVDTFFSELNKLDVSPHRCGVGIVDESTRIVSIHATAINKNNQIEKVAGNLKLAGHPILSKIFENWKKQEEYHPVLRGKEILEYYRIMNPQITFHDFSDDEIQYGYYFFFKEGGVFAWTDNELNETELQIFRRYTSVLSLTYRRYFDLQEAERQNKIIQFENERKTRELEEARELQLAMLPKDIPQLKDYEIAVYMKTATEVGGDYYDFSFMHNGSLNVAIGDATGHGMKAGTMVTMIKSLFTANSKTEEIAEFFRSTNAAIKNANLKRMMLGFAMVNIYGDTLKVINAGMPSVYFYTSCTGDIKELGGHNLPLGAMHMNNYTPESVELNQGDILLMLSDGFPELQNDNGELFGYDRLINLFAESAKLDAQAIIEKMRNTGSEWVNDKDPDDDVTFVVIKVK